MKYVPQDIKVTRTLSLGGEHIFRVEYRDAGSRGKWKSFVLVNGDWRGDDLVTIVQRVRSRSS